MILLETRIIAWFGLSAKLLMCVILLASVCFHAEKRWGRCPGKNTFYRKLAKKGGVLCFCPAAVLLAATFLLQKKDISVVPAFIALNAGNSFF